MSSSSEIPSVCANDSFLNREELLQLQSSPEFVVANAVLFYLCILFCLICFGVWLALKNRFDRTNIRPSGLLFMSVAGCIVNAILNHFAVIAGSALPCAVLAILMTIVVPLLAGSIIARQTIFFFLSKFSSEAATSAMRTMADTGFAFDIAEETRTGEGVCANLYSIGSFGMTMLFCSGRSSGRTMAGPSEKAQTLKVLRFLTSSWGVISIVMCLTVPFLLVSFVIILANRELLVCERCDYIRSVTLYTMIVVGTLCCVGGVFMWLQVRRLPDPWGLRSESLYSLLCAVFAMIFFFLDVFFSRAGLGIYQHYYLLTIALMGMVAENSVVQLFIAWQAGKKSKVFRQVENNERLSLDAILSDPLMAEAFEKHLVHELGVESLLFIRDAEKWKTAFYDISPTARRARARKMYSTYIQSSGLYAINIPDSMTREVAKLLHDNVSAGDDDVPQAMFDPAVKELKQLLSVGAVPRFINSKAFADANEKTPIAPVV